jgi:hypothetical protein
VQLECFDENRGFAEACNRGVAAGDAEIVVLLNNDVDCRPDFLERLLAPLEQDPRVGSVAALMLQPGEQRIDSAGLAADVTLGGFPRLQGLDVSEAARERPVLAGPAGTAAAYRRAAWEQVGGLDEAIFAYMEDFDLALRLRSGGWQSVLGSTSARQPMGTAPPGSGDTAASGAATCSAGTGFCAGRRRRARSPRRRSSCSATSPSHATSRPSRGASPAGVRGAAPRACRLLRLTRSTRGSAFATRSR